MKQLIEAEEKYINKFKEEPYIIGMFWNDIPQLTQNILEAIVNDKKYNEYELLTKDQQQAFDDNLLVF